MLRKVKSSGQHNDEPVNRDTKSDIEANKYVHKSRSICSSQTTSSLAELKCSWICQGSEFSLDEQTPLGARQNCQANIFGNCGVTKLHAGCVLSMPNINGIPVNTSQALPIAHHNNKFFFHHISLSLTLFCIIHEKFII